MESQNKCLKITDICYFILETLLLFIYTNDFESVDKFEDWIDLLYAASRFSMLQLIIAYKCDAFQLARYCEMFEIKKDDAIKRDDKTDAKGGYEYEEKIYKEKSTNVVEKFKSLLTRNVF